MYIVTNTTTGETSTCDAIEIIIYDGEKYVPSDNPDGFKAMTIQHISPTEEVYTEVVYAFEGHTLSGTEPTGTYEWQDEPEPDEE